MATGIELVKSLKRLASGGGVASDDKRLTDEHILFLIAKHRSSLLIQQNMKQNWHDPQLYQESIVTLSTVDKAVCSPVVSGCTMKEGVLPSVVPLSDNQAITFIGPLDGVGTGWALVDPSLVSVMQSRRLTGSKNPIVYLTGNKLRLEEKVSSNIKYLKVRAIFEDPTKIRCSNDAECYNYETDDYPLHGQLWDMVTRSIMTLEFNISNQMIGDEVNDSRDDIRKIRYKGQAQ